MADIDVGLVAILPGTDGGTGDRWLATVNVGGEPAYDASGRTMEQALALLCYTLTEQILRLEARA